MNISDSSESDGEYDLIKASISDSSDDEEATTVGSFSYRVADNVIAKDISNTKLQPDCTTFANENTSVVESDYLESTDDDEDDVEGIDDSDSSGDCSSGDENDKNPIAIEGTMAWLDSQRQKIVATAICNIPVAVTEEVVDSTVASKEHPVAKHRLFRPTHPNNKIPKHIKSHNVGDNRDYSNSVNNEVVQNSYGNGNNYINSSSITSTIDLTMPSLVANAPTSVSKSSSSRTENYNINTPYSSDQRLWPQLTGFQHILLQWNCTVTHKSNNHNNQLQTSSTNSIANDLITGKMSNIVDEASSMQSLNALSKDTLVDMTNPLPGSVSPYHNSNMTAMRTNSRNISNSNVYECNGSIYNVDWNCNGNIRHINPIQSQYNRY
jgi:hypothetical protein